MGYGQLEAVPTQLLRVDPAEAIPEPRRRPRADRYDPHKRVKHGKARQNPEPLTALELASWLLLLSW